MVILSIIDLNVNASSFVHYPHQLILRIKMKADILQDTQRILDLIAKRDLDDDGEIEFIRLKKTIKISLFI